MDGPSQHVLTIVEICGIFIGLTACISMQMYSVQPTPYMDEIFHIPQAQNYCEGNFLRWDPKITTLPGLYFISITIIKPVSWMWDIKSTISCGVLALRSINVIFTCGNLIVLLFLTHKIHHKEKEYRRVKALLTAVTLSVFPLLYFFTFLYYTDVVSTFFVLLMYLLSLYDDPQLAAMVGSVAVLIRQTNIIWVIFVAGIKVADIANNQIRLDKKDIKADVFSPMFLLVAFRELFKSLGTLKSFIKCIIQETRAYIMVGILFGSFVLLNGSIVVGDHSAHQASFHFPQLLYFASFSVVFAFSHVLSYKQIMDFLTFIYNNVITVIIFCSVCGVMVWKFTYYHPYLLADNRHYTFYINTKIFQRHELVKFALIPGYLFAMHAMYSLLKSRPFLWKVVYVACVSLATIPQSLVEFRYFIIPYFIWSLNKPLSTYRRIFLEFLLYLAVNVFTIYMFMYKPFTWENSKDAQRFIW